MRKPFIVICTKLHSWQVQPSSNRPLAPLILSTLCLWLVPSFQTGWDHLVTLLCHSGSILPPLYSGGDCTS